MEIRIQTQNHNTANTNTDNKLRTNLTRNTQLVKTKRD